VRADTRLKVLTLPAHVVDVLLQLRLPTRHFTETHLVASAAVKTATGMPMS
jgi:hypothetical protein